MAFPTTQRRRPSADDLERSNSTASLFLGGPRKNWMPASRPTAVAPSLPQRDAPPTMRPPSHISVPTVPDLPEATLISPVTPGATLHSSILQEPVDVVTAPKNPAPPPAALPSPVPSTDSHPSPVIDQPRMVNSAATTSLGTNTNARAETAITAPVTTTTTATNAITNEAVSHPPNLPRTTQVPQASPSTAHIANLSSQGSAALFPQTVQQPHGIQSPVVTNGNPTSRLEHETFPDNHTWTEWKKRLEFVNRTGTHYLSCLFVGPRLGLLREAFECKDVDYLILHQLFCRQSLGVLFSENPFLDTPACQRGLAFVSNLLRPNQGLPNELVRAFARLPALPEEYFLEPWYWPTIKRIGKTLELLATKFYDNSTPVYMRLSERRFPFLVSELKTLFQLRSNCFMKVLFRSVARQLYDITPDIDDKLNTLFQKDWNLDEDGMDSDSLMKLVEEYRKLPMKTPADLAAVLVPSASVPGQVTHSSQPVQVTKSPPVSNSSPVANTGARGPQIHRANMVLSNGVRASIAQPTTPGQRSISGQYSVPSHHSVPSQQSIPDQQHPQSVYYNPYHPGVMVPIQQQQQYQSWPVNPHRRISPSSQGRMFVNPPSAPSNMPSMGPSPPSIGPGHTSSNLPTQIHQSVHAPKHGHSVQSVRQMPAGHLQASAAQQTEPRPAASSPAARTVQPQQRIVQSQNPTAYVRNQQISFPQQVLSPGPLTPQIQLSYPAQSPFLLPPPGYRAPQLVFCDPMRLALHQVDLLDPMKRCVKQGELAGDLIDTELFHYLSDFSLEPTVIDPGAYNYEWLCNVSADDVRRFPRHVETSLNDGYRKVLSYQSGCRNLRLRCIALKVSETKNADDLWSTTPTTWPSVFYIHVNGNELTPRRKAHNGKDLPVDITLALKEGENKIRIDLLLKPDECKNKRYLFAIEKMETHRYALVRSQVQTIPAETVRQTVRERLSQTTANEDLAVVTENLNLSLIDPFTARVFTQPARSVLCTHLDCFDLETFIMTKKSVSGPAPLNDKWRCPICDIDARPQLLRVDRFLEEVRAELINKNQLEAAQAIQIRPDGSWSLKTIQDVSSQNPERTSRSPSAKRKAGDDQGSGHVTSRAKVEISSAIPVPPQERVVIELDQ